MGTPGVEEGSRHKLLVSCSEGEGGQRAVDFDLNPLNHCTRRLSSAAQTEEVRPGGIARI